MTAYPGGCLTAARVMGGCPPADLTGFQDGPTWANQETQITVVTRLLEDCVEALSWHRLPSDTQLVLRHTMEAFYVMFRSIFSVPIVRITHRWVVEIDRKYIITTRESVLDYKAVDRAATARDSGQDGCELAKRKTARTKKRKGGRVVSSRMHAHRLVDLQGIIPRNPASRVAVQSRRALVVHERHEREVQRVLIVGGAVDHALGHLGNGAALLLAVGVSEDRIIRVAQPAAHAEASVRRAWNELTSVLVHPRQGAGWRAGARTPVVACRPRLSSRQ